MDFRQNYEQTEFGKQTGISDLSIILKPRSVFFRPSPLLKGEHSVDIQGRVSLRSVFGSVFGRFLGTEETMSARDMTGFCAFFSARKTTFLGDSLLHYTENPGEKQKFHWRKLKKPVEMAPRNCRFLSLVVVERVLTESAALSYF